MFDRRDDDFSIDELRVLDERLREAAGVDQPSPVAKRELPRQRMFAPRRMAVAGLMCAAILATAAVVLTPSDGGRGGIADLTHKPVTLTPLSKREAIALLSENAETGGLEFARGDQFFHTRWERTLRGETSAEIKRDSGLTTVRFSELRSEVEDRWTSFYREGAARTDVTSVKYPTESDRKLAERADAVTPPGVQWAGYSPDYFYYLGSAEYSREELLNYRPTSEQLIEDLTRHPVVDYEGDATGIWASLVETMTVHSLPVHLRATAIRALGMIPSVKILGARRDRLGRQGYAFALEHDGARDELLIEPTTAQVLSLRRVIVSADNEYRDALLGEVVIDQLLTRFEVVDALPADVQKSPAFKGSMPMAAIRQDRRLATDAHRRDELAIKKR
ncbi:MAG: hypothetical protein HY827_06955 [Actinobacteria bacterium]|nr:hypothetical protein [Actinomycetota bacterium]